MVDHSIAHAYVMKSPYKPEKLGLKPSRLVATGGIREVTAGEHGRAEPVPTCLVPGISSRGSPRVTFIVQQAGDPVSKGFPSSASCSSKSIEPKEGGRWNLLPMTR